MINGWWKCFICGVLTECPHRELDLIPWMRAQQLQIAPLPEKRPEPVKAIDDYKRA